MELFVIIQSLGILTLIIYVVSLQQRNKETFLLLQTGGTLLFILQYALTGRSTGAIVFGIVAIRGFVFYYYKKKNIKPAKIVLVVFLLALTVATYFTWQNMLSIIPFIATVAKTLGTWQDDMKWIRRTSVIAQSIMILYNITASMYTGALTEVCNLTSTIIAIWRYDFRKQKNNG